jgi:predicted transcriptional regulator
LALTGELALHDLQPAHGSNHRLQAVFSGSVDLARLDETRIAASLLGSYAAPVAVATTVIVGFAVVKALLWLFSRELRPEDVLAHKARRRLYEAVQTHPGASYRTLMDVTGLSDGGTRHHLATLARVGLIAIQRHGGQVLYFENHGRYDTTWKNVAALRDPELRRLHEWIQAHPEASQLEIIRQASQAWGLPRSATRRRLRRLMEWGLIHARQVGRNKRYSSTL